MKHLPLIALLALTACATVTADHEQVISIKTSPAGASCALTNSQGMWEIAKTPGNVTVPRGFSPLKVTCAKHGAGSATTMLEAQTRGRAYGNILLLGVPALVDVSTGAGYEYVPDNIELKLLL